MYSSICREFAECRVSLFLRGIYCSSANDLLRPWFGVVGRITRMERFTLKICNSKIYQLRRLATCILLLISQPDVAPMGEAGCPGFISPSVPATTTSDNMNLKPSIRHFLDETARRQPRCLNFVLGSSTVVYDLSTVRHP